MQIAKTQVFTTQAGWLCQAKEYANVHSLALFVRAVGRLQIADQGDPEETSSMVPGSLVEGVVAEPNRHLPDEHDIVLTVWGGGEMFELRVMPTTEVRAAFGTFDEGGQDLPKVIRCRYCVYDLLPSVPGLNNHMDCPRPLHFAPVR